ncbi:hypothetical protein FRB90_004455, partial [Tulasnella sp. 427]
YFEAFVKALNERGLDLHKVHVTKEEAVLWGVSHWGRFSKTKGAFVKTRKEKVKAEVKKVGQVVKSKNTELGNQQEKKGEDPKAAA